LRGNHEFKYQSAFSLSKLAACIGFTSNAKKKYGSQIVWKMFNEVFDYLPLAAVINSTTICYHRLNFLLAWRTITRHSHSRINSRHRPVMLNTHYWRFWRFDVVGSLRNRWMDVRQSRCWLAIWQ